jgi:hypothetical protein
MVDVAAFDGYPAVVVVDEDAIASQLIKFTI